jgi:putative sigma-54 modulation protein
MPFHGIVHLFDQVVRKKQVLMKPISVDEAILEMNMVNHDFFMFINAETDEVNVVYKRDDGNYGVLEPATD